MGRKKMTAEKFWSKVDKNGPIHPTKPELGRCWLWTGCTNKAGYGATSWDHQQITTHRLAYKLTHGFIPEGLNVLHSCDNPPCVNGTHLRAGTGDDNSKEMVERNRQSQGEKHSKAVLPNRPRGANHYAHKLTEADVLEMRRLFGTTKTMVVELASSFGVSKKTAHKALSGETWSHLPGAVSNNGHGDNHRFAKLTTEKVKEIRRLRETTGRSYDSIAKEFGLGMRTVADVITRKTWNHIT